MNMEEVKNREAKVPTFYSISDHICNLSIETCRNFAGDAYGSIQIPSEVLSILVGYVNVKNL